MGQNPGLRLSDAAYLLIRDRILSGEFRPGTPISRRRLSEDLELSIIPVTDALKHLEVDGLVESLPRIGTRVKIPVADEIIENYHLREALETQSARLFAERATTLQKRDLAKKARSLDQLYGRFSRNGLDWRPRLFHLHKTHAEFHLDVARATGCKPLIEAMERSHIVIFNWLYNSAADFYRLPSRWHQDLMDALTSGNPEIADRAMRRHTRFAMDEIVRRLGSHPADSSAAASFRGPQRKTLARSLRKRESLKSSALPSKPFELAR
jgi:DNA-binding GntR family transcriptional regulator